MIAARRERHRIGGFTQEPQAGFVGPCDLFEDFPIRTGICGDLRMAQALKAVALASPCGSHPCGDSALPSWGAGIVRSEALTAGNSIWMSSRSRSGPEMRPW